MDEEKSNGMELNHDENSGTEADSFASNPQRKENSTQKKKGILKRAGRYVYALHHGYFLEYMKAFCALLST